MNEGTPKRTVTRTPERDTGLKELVKDNILRATMSMSPTYTKPHRSPTNNNVYIVFAIRLPLLRTTNEQPESLPKLKSDVPKHLINLAGV